MSTTQRRPGVLASPTARRLIRAYGPVVAIALAFLLMVLLVPTIERTVTG